MRLLRDEQGLATLETVMSVVMLVPILFAIVSFGDAFQRWLAQDAAVTQAARYAAELGGDVPEVRALLADALRDAGIDPSRTEVAIEPARVGWREPIAVRVVSTAALDVPFFFRVSLPLRSSAIARGEVNQ